MFLAWAGVSAQSPEPRTFDVAVRTATPSDNTVNDGPSLFTPVQEQLGLKLDAQRAPVGVLVIERVEQPTEN